MSKAIEILEAAMQRAFAIRPKVGGFPYLAEVLRQAGVKKNIWQLPGCQSIYLADAGNVVMTMPSLIDRKSDVPSFDQDALIKALRTDQAGESTFEEFIAATWKAGVVNYDVDLVARTVAYRGINGEEYVEEYPAVEIAE